MTTTINNEHKELNFSSEREQSQTCLNSVEHEKNQGRKVLNVPNLRFPEFQGEWKRTIFKNVITLQRGSSPRPIIEYVTTSDDGVNWIKIGDMPHFGRIVTSTEEKITKEGAKKSRQVNKGDLILSNSMSYGLPYIMGIDGYIHDGWFVLKNFENTFDKDYLCNLLISSAIQNQYKRLAAGGVVQNISSDLVNSVSVSIPTMMEQKKISSLLNLIDERIATQNKIIEDLKKLKSAISENLFKDVKGNIVMLSEICEIIKGKQINGEFLSEKGKYYVMNGGTEPSGYYSDYNVEANTISISEGGNSCGYVQFNTSPFWSGGHCYTIRKIADDVDNLYLYHYLKSQEDAIMKLRIGSGLPNIQKKDLAMFKIKIPTVEQQRTISTFLSSLERKAEIEEMLLNAMKKEKQYLLRQMFI